MHTQAKSRECNRNKHMHSIAHPKEEGVSNGIFQTETFQAGKRQATTGVHPGNPIEKAAQAAGKTDGPSPNTPGASPALIQRFWEIVASGAPEPEEDLSHDPYAVQPFARAVSATGSPT